MGGRISNSTLTLTDCLFKGPKADRPRNKPFGAAHKLKPPALPGDSCCLIEEVCLGEICDGAVTIISIAKFVDVGPK